MRVVYLLFALYPCETWIATYHGVSRECDCEDFLEGVFSNCDKAKQYIPEYLDERHANLEWVIEDERPDCGYYHEYARADKNLVYHICSHEVH